MEDTNPTRGHSTDIGAADSVRLSSTTARLPGIASGLAQTCSPGFASDTLTACTPRASLWTCRNCPGGRSVTVGGKKSLAFQGVRSAAPAFLRVVYRNSSKVTVVVRLTVNQSQTTGVAFPPTVEEQRALTLRLNLGQPDPLNALRFEAPSGGEIALSAIAVSSW